MKKKTKKTSRKTKAKPKATAKAKRPMSSAAALKAIESLIGRQQYKQALALAADHLPSAPRQVALQLEKQGAVATARLGHREKALRTLKRLVTDGELDDADTYAVLGRTWMDRYDRSGRRSDLRKARDFYREGYARAETPEDRYYTAINTAAKSVFLGDEETAAEYCPHVARALAETRGKRTYWHAATAAELELIRKNYGKAARLYQKAVNRHPEAVGSHSSSWLQAQRLMRARATPVEERNKIWFAFRHLTDAPPAAVVATPPFRRLRVYAFDPGLARSMETAVVNEVTLKVPWEPEDAFDSLPPGPIGEYLEIIDYDPASGCFYEPIDLDDRQLLATDGLSPSEGNPKFHQQMVYAVAMNVIDHFERALGRPALWASRLVRNERGKVLREEYIQRLRIYPHAMREANAYYSPDKKSLLFGYFPAETDDPKVLPGGIIFSCLSHDVVAHEVTHALLDGLHPRFTEAGNVDVLAFHEAFADIVALFQHFSHPDVLRHEIARSRGDLGSGSLLGQLAQQFGRAIGKYGALRDALGEVDPVTKEWRPKKPSPDELESVTEPHARGAILVSAVFDAFLAIYNARIADLLRIATQGSGILEPGAIHPDLVNRLANEAAKSATHLLHICIRALDYCPPVDITFGDYLRAMITADVDMVPDDRLNYRLAIIEAFQRRGIYPADVRNLSVESLVWRPPRGKGIDLSPLFEGNVMKGALSPEWRPTANRRELWDAMNRNAAAFHAWLVNHCPPNVADELGLALSVDALGSFYRKRGVPTVEVHSVRLAQRSTPRNQLVTDIVVEVMQRRRAYFDAATQRQVDARKKVPDDFPHGDFRFRGGCTLLIDPGTFQVRYAITKHILSEGRLRGQREFRGGTSGSLRATYFDDPERAQSKEPFAMLHRTV